MMTLPWIDWTTHLATAMVQMNSSTVEYSSIQTSSCHVLSILLPSGFQGNLERHTSFWIYWVGDSRTSHSFDFKASLGDARTYFGF